MTQQSFANGSMMLFTLVQSMASMLLGISYSNCHMCHAEQGGGDEPPKHASMHVCEPILVPLLLLKILRLQVMMWCPLRGGLWNRFNLISPKSKAGGFHVRWLRLLHKTAKIFASPVCMKVPKGGTHVSAHAFKCGVALHRKAIQLCTAGPSSTPIPCFPRSPKCICSWKLGCLACFILQQLGCLYAYTWLGNAARLWMADQLARGALMIMSPNCDLAS